MLEKIAHSGTAKVFFFFCGINDSIPEGSGVPAEDELLNKHAFCYNVIEESVLPKISGKPLFSQPF